ncbi:hypothetical protein BDV95DRAFT_596382 [Massariosphaeria phaeospora]|uniref:Uncharacterized protein n=1 Tax=Massariosphaeria phaeospora TaxID=100035 RepID=A0A7C8IC01_9PLEO|nr:hypothetical protein BDV95DRAFT_596382 [Massariosphaeria phaeospora]
MASIVPRPRPIDINLHLHKDNATVVPSFRPRDLLPPAFPPGLYYPIRRHPSHVFNCGLGGVYTTPSDPTDAHSPEVLVIKRFMPVRCTTPVAVCISIPLKMVAVASAEGWPRAMLYGLESIALCWVPIAWGLWQTRTVDQTWSEWFEWNVNAFLYEQWLREPYHGMDRKQINFVKEMWTREFSRMEPERRKIVLKTLGYPDLNCGVSSVVVGT